MEIWGKNILGKEKSKGEAPEGGSILPVCQDSQKPVLLGLQRGGGRDARLQGCQGLMRKHLAGCGNDSGLGPRRDRKPLEGSDQMCILEGLL